MGNSITKGHEHTDYYLDFIITNDQINYLLTNNISTDYAITPINIKPLYIPFHFYTGHINVYTSSRYSVPNYNNGKYDSSVMYSYETKEKVLSSKNVKILLCASSLLQLNQFKPGLQVPLCLIGDIFYDRRKPITSDLTINCLNADYHPNKSFDQYGENGMREYTQKVTSPASASLLLDVKKYQFLDRIDHYSIFIPFYIIDYRINNDTYSSVINAITGDIYGIPNKFYLNVKDKYNKIVSLVKKWF